MKRAILAFCVSVMTLTSAAQISADAKTAKKEKQPHQYCARMKDGLLVMMEDEQEMTMEVTLSNGTRIKPDGSVTRPDGTVVILEEGECVDENGNIFPTPGKTKTRSESGKKEDEGIPPRKSGKK